MITITKYISIKRDLKDLAELVRADGEGFTEIDNKVFIALLDEIDRLNAERRWIPVCEKLPEIGFVGLCQVAVNGYVIAKYAPYDSKEGWTSDEIGYCEVTHYSPLPPAPESEG